MNFSDKTFDALAPFERYFKTATEADWCPNPGRAALGAMAEALTEKDGRRRTAVNHACGSCILRVVKRTGYLWFEDKAARAAEAEQDTSQEENGRYGQENRQEMDKAARAAEAEQDTSQEENGRYGQENRQEMDKAARAAEAEQDTSQEENGRYGQENRQEMDKAARAAEAEQDTSQEENGRYGQENRQEMDKARLNIATSKLVGNSGQLDWLPRNPRTWTLGDVNRTIKSITTDPDFLEDRPLLAVPAESGKGERYIVFAGNLRLKACKESGVKTAPVVVYFPESDEDRETVKRRAMLDNGSFGSWDYDALANEWDDLPLVDLGIPAWEPEQEKIEMPKPDLSDDLDFKYRIELTFESEAEQEGMFNELTERGIKCRILTL